MSKINSVTFRIFFGFMMMGASLGFMYSALWYVFTMLILGSIVARIKYEDAKKNQING